MFQANHLKSTGDGRPALYARDIPGKTDKDSLADMVAGHKFGAVRASVTMADGAVMPCVGMIHRMTTGMHANLGLFRIDGDQFVTNTGQAELVYRAGSDQDVSNAKGEGVAFKTLDGKKVFVAAGVDAVLALALMAASEVNKKFETTAWDRA